MSKLFNNHEINRDSGEVALGQKYLMDYHESVLVSDEDYSVSCYIEEYENNGMPYVRLRDKETDKIIEFWISPYDDNGIEQIENELQKFLSNVKRSSDFYKKDGCDWIEVQAIPLNETKDMIKLASYFAELFYSLNEGEMLFV